MNKPLLTLLFTLCLLGLLGGCAGGRDVRVTQGTETIGSAPSGTVFLTKEAAIVHVNNSNRVATFRNGNQFEAGAFLVVKDREGEQTALLKALPQRPAGLRTADVLEGTPRINNLVSKASPAEAERLSKIYRDPEQD